MFWIPRMHFWLIGCCENKHYRGKKYRSIWYVNAKSFSTNVYQKRDIYKDL